MPPKIEQDPQLCSWFLSSTCVQELSYPFHRYSFWTYMTEAWQVVTTTYRVLKCFSEVTFSQEMFSHLWQAVADRTDRITRPIFLNQIICCQSMISHEKNLHSGSVFAFQISVAGNWAKAPLNWHSYADDTEYWPSAIHLQEMTSFCSARLTVESNNAKLTYSDTGCQWEASF
jgi:hypothetical protein